MFKNRRIQTSFISSNSKLQHYLDHPILDIEDNNFNLLAWLKTQELRCPVLSAIARNILIVPVSTIASEITFSLVGHVISETRNSLNSETVKALICLKD